MTKQSSTENMGLKKEQIIIIFGVLVFEKMFLATFSLRNFYILFGQKK